MGAETGRELHREAGADKFFTRLTRDGSVLLVDGWIWHPMSVVMLYDIDDLARTPGYRAFEISCCEYDGEPGDWPEYEIHEGRLYAVDKETGKRVGEALDSAAVLAEERASREYIRAWVAARVRAADRIKLWYRRKKHKRRSFFALLVRQEAPAERLKCTSNISSSAPVYKPLEQLASRRHVGIIVVEQCARGQHTLRRPHVDISDLGVYWILTWSYKVASKLYYPHIGRLSAKFTFASHHV